MHEHYSPAAPQIGSASPEDSRPSLPDRLTEQRVEQYWPDYRGQTISLALFRFSGWRKLWVFAQMGLSHLDMRAPGLGFYKLVGTGSGVGFDLKPNFGRYGILTVWDNYDAASHVLTRHRPHRRWAAAADGVDHFLLAPTRSRGSWLRQTPFIPTSLQAPDGPIAVITRARLKLKTLHRFWAKVPDISAALNVALTDQNARFAAGLGEIPYINQITFSVWPCQKTLKRSFNNQHSLHAKAARAAMTEDWFAEYLFAYFALLKHEQFSFRR